MEDLTVDTAVFVAVVVLAVAAVVFTVVVVVRDAKAHTRRLTRFEATVREAGFMREGIDPDLAGLEVPMFRVPSAFRNAAITEVRGGIVDGEHVRLVRWRYEQVRPANDSATGRTSWDAMEMIAIVAPLPRVYRPVLVLPILVMLADVSYSMTFGRRVLTGFEDFDRRYYVTAEDADAVRELLVPRLRRWLVHHLPSVSREHWAMDSSGFAVSARYLIRPLTPGDGALEHAIADVGEIQARLGGGAESDRVPDEAVSSQAEGT